MFERRIALLRALCIRRHDTRANLAFEFGVSKRTIEYDVFNLSLFYPIYTVQGKGGGIFVMDGFYFGQERLDRKQKAFLLRILHLLSEEDKSTMLEIIKRFGGTYDNKKYKDRHK